MIRNLFRATENLRSEMLTNAIALTHLLLDERTCLLRFVQRIVGNAANAEDVTQGLWLRIQRVDDHPPIENRKAYLYRLARNLALDHATADRRRAEVLAEAAELLLFSAEAVPEERSHIARDQLHHIAMTIAGLPERTQQIFALSRLEGLSQRDVADRLGISRPTVEKHLRYAFDAIMALRPDGP